MDHRKYVYSIRIKYVNFLLTYALRTNKDFSYHAYGLDCYTYAAYAKRMHHRYLVNFIRFFVAIGRLHTITVQMRTFNDSNHPLILSRC